MDFPTSDGGKLVEIIHAVTDGLEKTKYATFIAFSILIWDMFVTFDLEVTRVWRARKTAGTTLFLINRYFVPLLFILDFYSQHIAVTTSSFCKSYQAVSTTLYLIPMAVIECVLIMRTQALYQNRRLMIFLSVFAALSITWMFGIYLILLRFQTFFPARVLGMTGCISGCTNLRVCRPLSILFWVPFLGLETCIIFLTVWKTYKSIQHSSQWRVSSKRIIKVLLRDGIIYYFVILGVSTSNFFIWVFEPYSPYVAVTLLKSLQATICSRLLLNLREVLCAANEYEAEMEDLSFSSTEISVMIDRMVDVR